MVAPVVWALIIVGLNRQPDWSWPLSLPWTFAMLVLIRPLLEEIVFRGLLQGWLAARVWGGRGYIGITAANLVASVIFVLFHLYEHAPLLALLVMLPSLIFGYFRDRYSGGLLPSIILHMFYNAGYFMLYPVY